MKYVPATMPSIIGFDPPNPLFAEREAEKIGRKARRAWASGRRRKGTALRRRSHKMRSLAALAL